MTDESSTARSPLRTDIQGLRAVAVLLVVFYHAGLSAIPGGYIGVDVFFVISGFLITNHLVTGLSATGRVNFAQFYARRARRILPASFVVLLLTLVGSLLFMPPALLQGILHDAIATALYVPNLLFASQGTNYLAETAASPYQHYWSLGVEEQFYLLWPLVLLVLWRLARGSRRRLLIVCIGIVVVSLVVEIVLTFQSQPLAFCLLPARAWELGVGGLIAIAGPAAMKKLHPVIVAVGGWAGILAILLAAVFFNAGTSFPGFAALLPVLGTGAVIFFGQKVVRFGPNAALSTRPMQFVGLISYSLYLVHWPILVIAADANGGMRPLPTALGLGLALLSIPLAWLLFRFVENPLRRPRRLTGRRPRKTLILAGAVSVVTVLVAVVAAPATALAPMSSARVASQQATPQLYPQFTGYVPSNLTPSIAAAANDVPVVYSNGCHLDDVSTAVQHCAYGDTSSPVTIALLGDSHAAQWFPALQALAVKDHVRLEIYTKSSCPWVDITVTNQSVPYTACDTWRTAVLAHLAVSKPRYVVLASKAMTPQQIAGGATAEVWAAGAKKTIGELPAASKAIVISDTPGFPETPGICLSKNLESTANCALPRSQALSASWIASESTAATEAGARVVNLDNYICSKNECGPILGSTLVYRDSNHLTMTFVKKLEPIIWAKLNLQLKP
ncbi:MAG: acyltransferase [Microbacteriaceae bacterium]|nr:acyltransferase [Microbacteriaceae bacterium]